MKAIRSGNFKDYIQSIRQLIPWIFDLDHMRYARSLTIHLRDMDCLASKHPNVHEHFSAGRFVAHKTQRSFSGMALDQAHEQLNALVKGDGGAVGLTEHPAALRRWMVAGPEISRMIQEFECNSIHSLTSHHDQSHNSQVTFKKDVEALVDAFCDLGNPFLEDSGDLMTLDTKDIMDEEVVKSIRNAQNIGQEQYTLFVQERLHNQKKNISDPIKKNKLLLFSKKKTQSRMDPQVVALKEDRSLFGRLYVASQTREGDLSNFFKHENQPWPPSLSKYGEMRVGTKSDLLQCLEALCPKPQYTPCVDVAVLDGAAVVQMLGPGTCTKFSEYVEAVFMPYIMRKLGAVQRLDVVWDIYKNDSLKSATRQNRRSGLRRRVGLHTAMPGNWQSFLRVNENKTELFSLLAEQLVLARVAGKEVYSTIHERVLSSPIRDDMRGLAPCTHEEADSRIFVHVADAARRGHRSVMVHTCDTDVLAIAVSFVHELLGINELWLAFGSGKHFRYIAAHEIAVQLGPEKSRALPMFHALTGCDTFSSFSGKGKKTAWNAWNAFPEVTDTFTSLPKDLLKSLKMPWPGLKSLWSVCMTLPAASTTSTKPGNTCTAKNLGILKTSLPPKQLYNNMYHVLYTRLAMCGVKHYCPHQIFLIHHFGDGSMRMEYGNQSGHFFHRSYPHAQNWPAVIARKHVEDHANVPLQDLNAVLCASVGGFVLRINA